MKTLKKSLCLVLALVFVLSLCTVGAGAAFTDDAEIKYDAAVGIMADLGILSGMGDGTFAPKATVTRAQAAKMIAYMILGKDNAERMPAVGSFSDVNAGDWYAKYVGYCAKQNIINGMGDGTFRPDDPVTGTQLAKMVLCAVGFGKGGEYVGDGWDFNAVADALTYGVYNNSEAADFADKATREECALYVFNALNDVKIQSYKDGAYTDGTQTYGEKVWKLQNKTGILMGNKAAGAANTLVNLDGITTDDTTFTAFAADTALDLIGHEVRVLYKDVQNDKGVYTSVYAVTDISDVMVPAAAAKLTGAAIIPWANYVAGTAVAAVPATGVDKVIVYNNTIIGYTAPEVFNIAQVTVLDSKNCTLDDGTVIDLAKKTDAAGKAWTLVDVAKGDYIEVIAVGNTFVTRATSKFENIKVTQITNAITGVTNNSYNNGQFVQSAAANVSSYLKEASAKLDLGSPYTFYKDSKGNFFRAENYVAPDTTTTTAVYFVKSFSIAGTTTTNEWGQTITGKTSYYVQCVDAAGEPHIFETAYDVEVDQMADDGVTVKIPKISRGPADLSFNDKGVATLTAAPATEVEKVANKSATAVYKTAITKFPAKPYYLTSDCTIIVLGATDSKKAAELGNLKVSTIDALVGDFSNSVIYFALPKTTSAAKDIRTIWIDGAVKDITPPENPVDNSYIYLAADTECTGYGLAADGKTQLCNFPVYVDGVMTSISVKDATPAAAVPADDKISKGFYTYTEKKGVYTLTAIDSAKVVPLGFSYDGATTLIYNGEISSSVTSIDAKSVAGMKVADLRTLPVGTAPITDIAGLEAYTGTALTVLVLTNATTGAFVGGVLYITA